MRRFAPAVGAALVVASLALLLLVAVGGDGRPRADGAGRGSDGDIPAPVVEDAARKLLERAGAAPATTSYSGTQFVAAWGSEGTTSQVLEVSHTPARGTTWRAATAPGAEHVPAVRTAAEAARPSLLDDDAVALMSRHYSLARAGVSQVAGRTADVVEARRPGRSVAQSPVARFWLDRASGLVLRREVYDGAGHRLRATAFVDITVREEQPSGPVTDTGGRAWSSTLDRQALHRMRGYGWDCPDELPGPLPLVDARRGGPGRQIVHLSYADGIASISVFQQRGSLDRGQLQGYRRDSVDGRAVWVSPATPRRVVWSAGGTVYTLVGDAPERTVDRAVLVLHDGPGDGAEGPMDRLGRGLDRVASWFNPFE